MKKVFLSIVILFALASVTVQAQEPQQFKVYLPMVLSTCLNQDNNWRIIQPVYSKNTVLNPSAEANGNNLPVNNAAIARSATYQKYGVWSWYIQVLGVSPTVRFTTTTLDNLPHYVTVRVRKPYPIILQASLNGNAKQLSLIEKIDNDWDLYGASFGANLANAATAVDIIADTSVSVYYIDGIQVEPLTYWTTYIDGTQDDCGWLGTPHASASERSAKGRAGGRSVDFFTEYGFQISKIIGAGEAGHQLGVDSYATLPGGELNSDKITSREFQIIGKFIANTEADLLQQKRDLGSAFYTNDSQLTRIRFNGGHVQKELSVRYNGGLEGDLSAFYGNIEIVEDEKYMEHQLYTEKASIQVVAPYPYWQEVGESAALLDTNDSATFRTVAARLRDTGQWDELGPPDAAGTYTGIYAIAEDANYVYFGGNFVNFDNIANADYAVRYNKSTGVYSAMGTGLDNEVYSITIIPGGLVYYGGSFTTAGGGAANYFAVWNPGTETWSAVGVGTNGTIYTTVLGNNGLIYLGGSFTTAGGGAALRFASYNPITLSYSSLGAGTDNDVTALAAGTNGLIYLGGWFNTAGGGAALYVASYNPTTSVYSALGAGMDNGVQALAVDRSSGILYAAGLFNNPANYIAFWNGTEWSGFGNEPDSGPNALAVGDDGVLYAVGGFTTIGSISFFDGMAKWNGSTWGHLDIDIPGSPSVVFSILVSKYSDPVVRQKYSVYIGGTSSVIGTGYYGGIVTVSNDGNVLAFPKIIYTRSGGTTAVLETLRNEDTGKEILLNYGLLDGETLTIDLNPTNRTITSSAFGLRMDAALPSDTGSWALDPNDNDITSFVATSGAPDITAYILWRDTFSGY